MLIGVFLLVGSAFAQRFEWRNVEQDVTIHANGWVEVEDTRTLWTDGDFGEAFLCLFHGPDVTIAMLDRAGAVSPGPEAVAYTQACESGNAGTELVIEQERRVSERRVRFHYLLMGALDAHEDVVQWYWEIYGRENPPAYGYDLTVTTPSPGSAPYDAFVHRFWNPEVPKVALSPTRDRLQVSFDQIPAGEGVEIRYLMPPHAFTMEKDGDALEWLLQDEARLARESMFGN